MCLPPLGVILKILKYIYNNRVSNPGLFFGNLGNLIDCFISLNNFLNYICILGKFELNGLTAVAGTIFTRSILTRFLIWEFSIASCTIIFVLNQILCKQCVFIKIKINKTFFWFLFLHKQKMFLQIDQFGFA